MTVDDLGRRASTAAQRAVGGSIIDAVALPGSASSLTYAARLVDERGDRTRVVLKVAPPGVQPVRNRDVLRQARLLRALASAPGIEVSRVVFEDAGDPPDTPPFFVMTFVDGESFEPHIDECDQLPPEGEIHARALGAARMLAALHAVPRDHVGLGDEPVVGLDDEVDRWVYALSTVEPHVAEQSEAIAARLRRSLPRPAPGAIVHGDYRLGNTLCHGPDVRALIDWEIWSPSDPRVDVAWFLLTADPASHPSAIRDAPGMPRPPELLDAYRAAGGTTVDDLAWFRALALYKVGAAVALIAKHRAKRRDVNGAAASAAKARHMLDRAAAVAVT